MSLLEVVLLTLLSLALVVIFRDELLDPHTHGFYRFFVFEALLALVVLNSQRWFHDPLSLRQLLSWIALLSSLLLALHGFRLLRTRGQPQGAIEDTTKIVTTGAYRYIRHPLYTSLVLFGLGAFLKGPALLTTILMVVVLVCAYATARVEEQENVQRFGEAYWDYMKGTKRFIPFLF